MDGNPKSYRILVVDDEQPVLDVMTAILSASGWQVEPFVSPVKALRRAKYQRFDALVTDLYMPELPGMLFHARLKLVDAELARRTVFVTGHFKREELRRDLEESATVLMKPFSPAELVGAVERILPSRPRHLGGGVATG